MLYQLDDLNLSPCAFRLVFSIIRHSYHTKIFECTLGKLAQQTDLSIYHIRNGIKELVERKLIQATRTQEGYEFVLMPALVKIINLDFKRKGKKPSISPAQLRDSGKKNSGFNTKNYPRKQKNQQKATSQNGSPPRENTAPSHTKPKPVLKKSMNSHQATENIAPGPWLNKRGCLQNYFLTYLYSYEKIESTRLSEVTADISQLRKLWRYFTEYCIAQVNACRAFGKYPRDLNQYKFWKKIYIEYKEA